MITSTLSQYRFKSLIQKIYKDDVEDEIEELQAIKEYLNKEKQKKFQNHKSKNPKLELNIQDKLNQNIEYQKLLQIYLKKSKQKNERLRLILIQKIFSIQVLIIGFNNPKRFNKFKSKTLRKIIYNNNKVINNNRNKLVIKKMMNNYQSNHFFNQINNKKTLLIKYLNYNQVKNNKKDLSTPNTLSYYFQPKFQQLEELKPDYQRFIYVPISSIQQQFKLLSNFPFFLNKQNNYDLYTCIANVYVQQQQCKYEYVTFIHSQYIPRDVTQYLNLISINLVKYVVNSIIDYIDQMQNEQSKQQQFNTNLTFLKSNNQSTQHWIKKRTNEKQNQPFYDSLQSLDQ